MATSHQSVLDRLLEPLAESLTTEAAEQIVGFRADAEVQQRLDELADGANEGTLSEVERAEYAKYVEAIDLVAVLQAKARAVLDKRSAS